MTQSCLETAHWSILQGALPWCLCDEKRILKAKCLQTAKTSYYAMIESELRYGISGMWRNLQHQTGERTCFHHKRAVQCLARLNIQDSCREVYKTLKFS